MTKTVDLTISCVLYNTDASEVNRMIDQIASIPLSTHLYIVDNSPGLVESSITYGNLTRISTGRNLGYGKAHNIAIARSRSLSKYHLISNTDITFQGADISILLEKINRDTAIGLIAPRVRYPNGDLQHLCRLLPTPLDLVAKRFFGWSTWGKKRSDRYELRMWGYDCRREIPFLSGCFMLARHSALERVRGFDERFFLYFEDLDLSRRIGMISKTIFDPEVEITHDYRSKNSQNRMLLKYLIVSGFRYFAKWGWLRDDYRDRINFKAVSNLL